MDILLDTHTFLWYLAGNTRLSTTHRALIADTSRRKFLSIVSLWEIAIKSSTGKLALAKPLAELVPAGIDILPLQLKHLLHLQTLPLHHRDPFDRAIIAQAQVENLQLLSVDGQFAAYGVSLL